MPIGRAERFKLLKPRVILLFGEKRAPTVFELLELTEMAWHDCYGEIGLPDGVMDDVLLCSGGNMENLVHAVNLAVIDWRDLRVWASQLREAGTK